ncbi:MAG TPA: DUF6334 family protein [Terriglobia bacterium]|nr:DUF6334 family protein [Terriglobia bacterium]
MLTAKLKAAEALAPMLSTFHSITGKPLVSVWQCRMEGSLDRVVLDFDGASLVILADENDDSIDLTLSNESDRRSVGDVDASGLDPWRSFIGMSFGWGWVTVNQQGYCDGVLLSFGGIFPQIALNVVASSIKVAAITGVASM